MRDPKRIRKFCNELAALWERVPDLRFGQLISNAFDDCPNDPFVMEDNEMINVLKKYVDNVPMPKESEENDSKEDLLTPEEFAKEMQIIASCGYEEEFHSEADDLICRLLIALGYREGVEIFKKTPKRYA